MWTQQPPLGTLLNFSDPLTRKLRLALFFNERAGGIINDSSQNGHTGRLTGVSFPATTTSGWVPSKDGGALATDDVNDWVDFGNVLNMGTSNFTVFLRFIGTSWLTTATSGGRLIQKRGTGAGGANPGWSFTFFRAGLTLNNIRYANSVVDDGTNFVSIASSDIVTIGLTNEVTNLAIVIDRERGEWRTYSDIRGGLIHTENIAAITDPLDNTRKLTLGGSDVVATQYGGYKYLAVMLWERALTVSEVQQITANPYRIVSEFDMSLLVPIVAGMPMPLLMQTMDHFNGGAVL